jgi:hypothetical protein
LNSKDASNHFLALGVSTLFHDRFQTKILMELKAVPARYDDAMQLAKYKDELQKRSERNIWMWLVTRTALLLLGFSALVSGQPPVVPKPVLSVREVQVPRGLALQIDVILSGALHRDFAQKEQARVENYQLFLVNQPDEPEMHVEEITEQLLGTLDPASKEVYA